MSVVMGTLKIARAERPVQVGYRRKPFGWFIHLLVANPVMPLVVIAAVAGFVVAVFVYFGENNNGVEFFVETEPEQAIVYVRARGNLSIEEMDALVTMAEQIVITQDGVRDVFAFAGDGGLNNNTGGVSAPGDTIGQIQVDLEPWGRPPRRQRDPRRDAGAPVGAARHRDRDPRRRAGPRRKQAREPAPVWRQLGRSAGRDRDRAGTFSTRCPALRWWRIRCRCPVSTGRSMSMSRPPAATVPTWPRWAPWCSW